MTLVAMSLWRHAVYLLGQGHSLMWDRKSPYNAKKPIIFRPSGRSNTIGTYKLNNVCNAGKSSRRMDVKPSTIHSDTHN